MPELAEVRTVASTLKRKLIGKTVTDTTIIYPKIIEPESMPLNNLIGCTLKDIETKGKYLLFNFGTLTLISHLRMEGKYFIKEKADPIEKHEHIIINFDNVSLRYHDTRKFGRMCIVNKKDIMNYPALKKLADEPFTMDKEKLYSHIHAKSKPIKSLLLEQDIIAGLGNIYADEVLYQSKISPFRLGNTITLEECDNIITSAKEILTKAIEEGGTTIKSYTSSLGVIGNYQNFLKVHKKEGQACKCGTIIKRIKLGGRSTYYCENCQR